MVDTVEQHLMVDIVIPNEQNSDPLKRAHSPQGMLSLIDSTECCGIKRKDEECYMQVRIRDTDSEVKLYHRAYLRCLGKSACLKQELQQSKCRDLLCSKQETLKGDNPTECHMKAKFNAPDPLDYLDSICSNTDPLNRAHSPQGMLSLIDPTGCCVMKRKDGESTDPEIKLYH